MQSLGILATCNLRKLRRRQSPTRRLTLGLPTPESLVLAASGNARCSASAKAANSPNAPQVIRMPRRICRPVPRRVNRRCACFSYSVNCSSIPQGAARTWCQPPRSNRPTAFSTAWPSGEARSHLRSSLRATVVVSLGPRSWRSSASCRAAPSAAASPESAMAVCSGWRGRTQGWAASITVCASRGPRTDPSTLGVLQASYRACRC